MKEGSAGISFEGYRKLVKSWVLLSTPEDLIEEVWDMNERKVKKYYHLGLFALLSIAVLSLLLSPIVALVFIVLTAVVPRLRMAGYKFSLAWAKGLYLHAGDKLLGPQPRWIKALRLLIALFLLVFLVYLSFFGGR